MQNVCAKGAWVLGWDGAVMKVSHLVHGFPHVYSFKGSLLASHGFQFYWLQRPLWPPMSCQAVIPPHQYHNAAIPISKQGTIPWFYEGFILQVWSLPTVFFVLNVHHIHDWFFLISTIAIPVLRQQVRDPSNSSLQSWETLPAHQKEWTKSPLNPITLMPTTSLYSGKDWQPGPPGQIHHSWRARLPILATVLLLGSVATWFTQFTPSGELRGFPMTAVNYWMGLWLAV